jgi:hypothetical protein
MKYLAILGLVFVPAASIAVSFPRQYNTVPVYRGKRLPLTRFRPYLLSRPAVHRSTGSSHPPSRLFSYWFALPRFNCSGERRKRPMKWMLRSVAVTLGVSVL